MAGDFYWDQIKNIESWTRNIEQLKELLNIKLIDYLKTKLWTPEGEKKKADFIQEFNQLTCNEKKIYITYFWENRHNFYKDFIDDDDLKQSNALKTSMELYAWMCNNTNTPQTRESLNENIPQIEVGNILLDNISLNGNRTQVGWDRYSIDTLPIIKSLWNGKYILEVSVGKARWNFITAKTNISLNLEYKWWRTLNIFDENGRVLDTIVINNQSMNHYWRQHARGDSRNNGVFIPLRYDGKTLHIQIFVN